MHLKRRQFLLLGGVACGLVGGCAVHQARRSSDSVSNGESGEPAEPAIAPPTPAPKPEPTFPAPEGFFAPQRGDVRLVVISDLNGHYGSTDYRIEVEEGVKVLPDWEPDLVVCAGDMVAAQSTNLSRSDIEAMWTGFDRRVFTPLRQSGLPFAFTLGNHDASSVTYQSGEFIYALDRELADAFWNQPDRDLGITFADRAGFPFYYSFEHREIFYLVWDASSATVSPTEIDWAEQTLASEAAQQAKLRIAIGHLPFYAVSEGRDRPGEILDRADELRSLLEKHKVHTYISGHHHAYFPGHNGQLDLLHAGALGSGPRSLLGTVNAPYQTLTVVDIDLEQATTTYTTYNMTTQEVVDDTQLPELLAGPNGQVIRRDLALAEPESEA